LGANIQIGILGGRYGARPRGYFRAVTAKVEPIIEALAGTGSLDRPAQLVADVGGGAVRSAAQRAHAFLGHPAHPALTDMPIGFWTSAWTLDLLPGRARSANAARTLIGLGVLSTMPAVVSGVGDAAALPLRERRLSAAHASLNVAATVAFALSWWMRRNETSNAARAVAHVGAALATAGATIGGHLAFRPADTQPGESRRAGVRNVWSR
jgi:uncharacterized membrane protein